MGLLALLEYHFFLILGIILLVIGAIWMGLSGVGKWQFFLLAIGMIVIVFHAAVHAVFQYPFIDLSKIDE